MKAEEFDYFHEMVVQEERTRGMCPGYEDGLDGAVSIGAPVITKYGSEWNTPEIQQARYDTICAEAHWEQLYGRSQPLPTFTEFLQAIAALKSEKNVKGGGTVAEM